MIINKFHRYFLPQLDSMPEHEVKEIAWIYQLSTNDLYNRSMAEEFDTEVQNWPRKERQIMPPDFEVDQEWVMLISTPIEEQHEKILGELRETLREHGRLDEYETLAAQFKENWGID